MTRKQKENLLKSRTFLGWLFRKLPRGSIWQSRYVCLPLAIIASTFALTHTTLPVWQRILYFILGLVTWTFLEYLLHRFVLHWIPKNGNLKEFIENIHLIHHDHPEDESIVCISALNCLILWLVIFAFFLVFGGWQIALLVTSGTALLMVIYDITHYSTHYMDATNWFLKGLKRNHMQHHFSDHHKRFGVTTPFWDYVFGTRG